MTGRTLKGNRRKLTIKINALQRMLLVSLCLSLAMGGVFSTEAKTKKKSKTSSTSSGDLIVTEKGAVKIEDQILKNAFDKVMKEKVRPDKKLKKYKYLYVGASRATKIKKNVSDSATFFATEPGAGAHWFSKRKGKSKPCTTIIRSYLEVRPDGNVIIEMGNNGVQYVDAYIYFYGKLIEAYPEAHFWFVDVLPGSGPGKKGAKKNPSRKKFNRKLREAFPDNCLGGYNYLLHSPGFRTTDGTHYPTYVARNLYMYVMKKLGRKIRYSGKKVITVKG